MFIPQILEKKYNIHRPSSVLSLYQKGIYKSGIKLFNTPPPPVY